MAEEIYRNPNVNYNLGGSPIPSTPINPTPAQVNNPNPTIPPAGQVFASTGDVRSGDISNLYRIVNGQVEVFNPTDILSDQEKQSAGNVGGQRGMALQKLGINPASLPSVPFPSELGMSVVGGKSINDIKLALNNKPNQTGLTTGNQNPPVIQSGVTTTAGMNVSSPASLFNNATILALEEKIKEQSAEIKAGLAVGGKEKILKDLFTEYGVSTETDTLKGYNQQILSTQKLLREIPDNIKTTLQGVGITDAQWNRLVLKETQKPLETLRDLMELKGAAQEAINTSLKFVGLFADAKMADQAAQIEAAKFDLENNKDLLTRLDKRQTDMMNLAIDDRKARLLLANDMLTKGADADSVNAVQNASSYEDAQKLAQPFYQQNAKSDKLREATTKLFTSLTGDKNKDSNLIRSYSAIYGVDANDLIDNLANAPTGTGTLTYKDQLQISGQLRDDARMDPDIKVFPEVRQAYETIVLQSQRKDAVGDLVVLRLFAKLTDPPSSVREEEFESMESAQSALARLGIRLTSKQIYGTRLTDSARQEFVSSAKQIYESRQRNYETASDRIRQNAIDAGLNPDRIITPQLAELVPAFTDTEKTQALNDYLGGQKIEADLGFFDDLLSVFGLQTK